MAAPPTRIRTQGGVVSVVSDGAAVGAEGYSPTGNFPAAFRQQQQQDLGKTPRRIFAVSFSFHIEMVKKMGPRLRELTLCPQEARTRDHAT